MSKLTLYSYSAERCAASNRRTDADLLVAGYSLYIDGSDYGYPFSGDMLTVLAKGNETQKYNRRRRANRARPDHEVTQ